jgi:hypothetical protein
MGQLLWMGEALKITIESTSKLVEIQVKGTWVPARVWEGQTESGIKVHCYITRIAAGINEDLGQFERELQEQAAPSAEIQAIPLRMII